MSMKRHFGQTLKFILMTNSREFIASSLRTSRFSSWEVEIFMIKSGDFYHDRSRFSSWQAEIFIMTGRGFLHVRSRFSSWQVEIFFMKDPDFYFDRSRFSSRQVQMFFMKGLDFHQDRSRFSLLIVSVKIPERKRSVLRSSFYVKLPDY